jgi:hypothetical protein
LAEAIFGIVAISLLPSLFLISAETVIFGQISAVFFPFLRDRLPTVEEAPSNPLNLQGQGPVLAGTCFAEVGGNGFDLMLKEVSMNVQKHSMLTMAAAIFVTAAVATTPALAKDAKKSASHKSAAAAAAAMGPVPTVQQAPKAGHHDEKPGPAWKTVGGTLKEIKGNSYTVEDFEGNQVKLYVGQGTKHIKQKKVGDTVRAEITRGGFANSIQ